MTKHIATFIALTCLAWAQESNVTQFQSELAKWDQIAADKSISHTELALQREKLLSAWNTLDNMRSGSMDQAVASVDRQLLKSLVDSKAFTEASKLLVWHEKFCADNSISLLGKSKDGLAEFVELHATITASLRADPLDGKNLPYELIGSGKSFLAISEWEDDGQRVDHVDGDIVDSLPDDQTLGQCVVMDSKGHVIKTSIIGLLYPPSERKLIDRIVSVWIAKEAGPNRPGGYVRVALRNVPELSEFINSETGRPTKRGPMRDSTEAAIDQNGHAQIGRTMDFRTLVLWVMIPVITSVIVFFLLRNRRSV